MYERENQFRTIQRHMDDAGVKMGKKEWKRPFVYDFNWSAECGHRSGRSRACFCG